MAGEASLLVATIGGWQTPGVARSIEFIDGVEKVERADGDPDTLVVAIEGEIQYILREIGRMCGVIFVRPAGNGD